MPENAANASVVQLTTPPPPSQQQPLAPTATTSAGASSPTSKSQPPDPIIATAFQTAINEFKTTLDNGKIYSEILQTTSIDQVYDLTDRLQRDQAKRGHLQALGRIAPFLDRLSEYAGVIEVFVQAKPDVLALLWGPLKLLIKWTSEARKSFEAILSTIAELGELLPEFLDMAKLFRTNDRVKDVLVLFFRDILDFYVVALKFFGLSRWGYLFDAMWPRHKEKIKLVSTHIERHTLLLRNEVRLEHIQEEHDYRLKAFKHFEETEKSIQRQEYYSIKADLAPITYGGRLEQLRGATCRSTGDWLLDDPTFCKWVDHNDANTRILWLQGIPGAGKTFLASVAVDKVAKLGSTTYAFLSHERQSALSALQILHSLTFEITTGNPDLQTILCQRSLTNLKSDLNAARELLETLLNCAGPSYLIVDGLDEIDESERTKLIEQLLIIRTTCSELKIMVSSRAEDDIQKALQAQAVIRVDNHNLESIRVFVKSQSQQWLREAFPHPEDQHEIRKLLLPIPHKAKGMFLYAKIVLSNVALLNDLEDIRSELAVLPETLDDVYGRVVGRLNKLQSKVLKTKAQRLLAWISCTPVPLKIQEIEQALLISTDPTQTTAKVTAELQIVKICGPIIEVVDEYVRFVHFTVKEYLLSPHISGFTTFADATLDLTLRCITYLSQPNQASIASDQAMTDYILAGTYRFQTFASQHWLPLVQQFSKVLQERELPHTLIDALNTFEQRMRNPAYEPPLHPLEPSFLDSLTINVPGAHRLLEGAVAFTQAQMKFDFDKTADHGWTDRYPTTTSYASVLIHQRLYDMLCQTPTHKEDCRCDRLQYHYGKRLFTCGLIDCPFSRHGFETNAQRRSHAKQHKVSWSCSVQDCPHAKGGFLSRKSRDEHWELYHRKSKAAVPVSNAVILGMLSSGKMDEILPDIVKLDQVMAVKECLPISYEGQILLKVRLTQIEEIVASFATSTDMLEMISDAGGYRSGWDCLSSAAAAVAEGNVLTFDFLLGRVSRMLFVTDKTACKGVIKQLMYSDSEEMWSKWNIWRPSFVRRKSKLITDEYILLSSINATDGMLEREQHLLDWWREQAVKQIDVRYFNVALCNVAESTCSLRLAKALLDFGANVNCEDRLSGLSPLELAASHDTAEAAVLLQWLLTQGADPFKEIPYRRESTKIGKGAENIRKWLGVSWDELVAESRSSQQVSDLPTVISGKPTMHCRLISKTTAVS